MTHRPPPPTKPEDLFRVEKERALTVRNSQHARLLAEAKAAFDKLMAEGQAARKSGRPRKHPLPPLKTSSARPSVKPPAPPLVVKASAPVSPPAKPANVAKAASVNPQPVSSTAAPVASVSPLPRVMKPAKAARAKKVVKAAGKSKPKAKRSTRR